MEEIKLKNQIDMNQGKKLLENEESLFIDGQQAEAVLKEQEERYRTLVDNIPGAVYRCSHDQDWTAIFFSEAIRDITGYPASDFIGNKVRSYASIIHPADMAMVDQTITKALNKRQAFTVEYRIICANDMIRWVYEKGQGIYDEKGELLWLDGVIIEVSAHKQTKDALRDREDRFRALTALSPVGIFQANWNGQCIYMNRRLSEITGKSDDEAYGEGWIQFIHPEDREHVISTWRKTVEEAQPFYCEYRLKRPNGESVWTLSRAIAQRDETGKISGFIGTVEDITDRKKAEEALKESEEQAQKQFIELNQLYKTAPVGLCLIDREMRYVRINEVLAAINGKPAEEHIGRTLREIIPEIADQIEEIYRKVIEAGESILGVEVQGVTPAISDEEKSWLVSYYPLKSQEGEVLGVSTVVQDITDPKRTEKALKDSQEELKKQKLVLEQKNTALQEILGQIEIEKKQIKDAIIANVEEFLLPALKKLRRKGTRFDNKSISLLEKNLEQITSGFGTRISSRKFHLTPREIEICNMIKNGLSSKEIANIIHISFRTIEIHRNNIRKKLDISGKGINLTSYLQSFN